MRDVISVENLGKKNVLKLTLWDDEKGKIEETCTVLKNDENVSFYKFRTGGINTVEILVLSDDEKHLERYKKISVKGTNRRI